MDRKKIAHMEWEEFEASLAIASRGGKSASRIGKDLEEYFGKEEYDSLQKLATHARSMRSRVPVLGNVVFLPGIMGSNLITVEKDGDEDLVWVNLLRLAVGQIERLKLSPDGSQDDNPDFTVKPSDLDKRTYARTILWLKARWNVYPFPYDWRKDMDISSAALAAFIREKCGGEPAHLVAHSMGGLVSRNFIRLHRDLWDKMAGSDGGKGGRLIMLGTPNFGSFVIPQTFTGVEKMVRLLAAADLTNSLAVILEIINTFVGSYEMLPAPSKIPLACQVIYRKESWGDFPVSENHLGRAFQFHTDLERADTVDPGRMVYIAGCNRETLAGLKLIAPGEFDYTITYEGDGRVPHALGLLKDVPAYYVDASHGDLPRNQKVLAAVDELLESGSTSVLPDLPIAARALLAGGAIWRRPIGEQRAVGAVRDIAVRAAKKEASPEELRFAEESIMCATTGQDQPVEREKPSQGGKKPSRDERALPFHIEVVRGDVTQMRSPVVVIGHYKGVAPVSAEGAIDEAMGYWITRAGQQGMIGADLGELFFIPIVRGQIAARAVLLAGMGEEGKFTKDDLRYLMANVTYAVSALGLNTFAAVLIGSGEGNLSKDRALRGMVEGIGDALIRLPKGDRLEKLTLVERDDDCHRKIIKALERLREEKVFPDLCLEVTVKRLPQRKSRQDEKERPPDIPSESFPGTRITVERDGDTFRFSALTKTAVIPVREVEVQSFFASGTSERLMSSVTPEEQIRFGQLLATYLIPQDFRQLIDDADSLTLILDRSTSSFPWEMACLRSTRGVTFFGPDLKLTRQFRTMLSSPGLPPPLNRALKVLVIADPAPEPEFQLPGARREGREVVRVLNHFKKKMGSDITVVDRIGSMECDPIEILALLLIEEFDVVHYAGHGVFDEENPSRSGWVFGEGRILSAKEIFRARRVPRLVFANACFSAVIRERKTMTADQKSRRLAGLAEAFFERGIQNYIGAGWPVDDEPAVEFATVFYENALLAQTLADSLAAARKKIMGQGSTWGAYQHYGQVNAQLLTNGKEQD